MFESLNLKNFKSFSDLHFDFRYKNNNKPKNLISLYGENGSGKSNVVEAFKVLKFSTMTTYFAEKFATMQTQKENEKEQRFDDDHFDGLDDMFLAIQFKDLPSVLQNTSRISAESNTQLIYHFSINGISGEYTLSYDSECHLIKESLYYLLNERRGFLFSIEQQEDEMKIHLNESAFRLSSLRTELSEKIQKLWGKHTFLAIFKQYQNGVNDEYISKNVSQNFLSVIEFFDSIAVWTNDLRGPFRFRRDGLLPNLDSGVIEKARVSQLKRCESVIFTYFSSLYPDIKDVFYEIKERGNKADYQLVVKKNVSGKLIEIPFLFESNGTKNLLDLLQVFFWVMQGRTAVVDEIDNGIHDLLMNSVISNAVKDITGQLIFTTHDTYLLKEIPASSAYFINLDSMGNKQIFSGNDYEKKVLKNNNMQKMYLDGLFNAVPDPLPIDFTEIFEPLEDGDE